MHMYIYIYIYNHNKYSLLAIPYIAIPYIGIPYWLFPIGYSLYRYSLWIWQMPLAIKRHAAQMARDTAGLRQFVEMFLQQDDGIQ